jgi:hypothetical protein
MECLRFDPVIEVRSMVFQYFSLANARYSCFGNAGYAHNFPLRANDPPTL